MFYFHFVFHVAFWMLSLIFAIQLFYIRRQQKDLYRREFNLYKKHIDKNVDDEFLHRQIEKRFESIEAKLERIIQQLNNK